eukprot:6016987-Prymnesium_polylepis.1
MTLGLVDEHGADGSGLQSAHAGGGARWRCTWTCPVARNLRDVSRHTHRATRTCPGAGTWKFAFAPFLSL